MYKFINQHKLTKIEANFLALIISQVEMQDQKFKCYIINRSEFPHELDFKTFFSKPLKIIEEDSTFITNYFTTIEMQTHFYRVSISEKLKPYLAELNKRYDIDALQSLFTHEKTKEIVQKSKSVSSKDDEAEYNLKIKRVVNFFDQERKKLQANYVRKEFKNTDAQYSLRIHLKESGRTPEMFFDAIRWLFSNNPKAAFHRDYIMNIAKLIEHFNTLEHQAMHSKEAIEFNEEAQTWSNIYKKQGLSDEQILEKLREAGYIK
nr:RepB family plasmid replication initiator protein [uncultured Sulfurimonas sp.]